jgi:hypothetical protein
VSLLPGSIRILSPPLPDVPPSISCLSYRSQAFKLTSDASIQYIRDILFCSQQLEKRKGDQIHTHTHTHTHTVVKAKVRSSHFYHTHNTYTHTYIYTYILTNKHTHSHIECLEKSSNKRAPSISHMHIYTYTHKHIYSRTHVYTYRHTYIHIHTYTYAYIHMYTYNCWMDKTKFQQLILSPIPFIS